MYYDKVPKYGIAKIADFVRKNKMKHFKDFFMADWNFDIIKYFHIDINTSKN